MVRNENDSTDVEKLAELIRGVRVAMLTTALPDGALHSRPMGAQETPFDGELWFLTEGSSGKVAEIQHDQRVNLSYAKPDEQTYVSLTGRARVVHDREKAKALWSPFLKAWFPQGVDDPDMALIRVEVEQAEYWEGPPGAVVRLVGFVKAVATGKRYEGGENKKVDLGKSKSEYDV